MNNNENPYKVPQGYFAELKGKILQKTTLSTDTEEHKKKNSVQFVVGGEERRPKNSVNWRSIAGFAAGFAIFVILGVGGVSLLEKFSGEIITGKLSAQKQLELSDANLFAEAVFEYVEQYGGMDEEDIILNQNNE